jgi:hypothetical protein
MPNRLQFIYGLANSPNFFLDYAVPATRPDFRSAILAVSSISTCSDLSNAGIIQIARVILSTFGIT